MLSRFGPCRCGVACRRSITPVAEVMPDRCTPEYERAVAAMGAALPYRRALAPLGEFFPLGEVPAVETTRQRPLQVGVRLERAALARPQPPAAVPEAGTIALAIDARIQQRAGRGGPAVAAVARRAAPPRRGAEHAGDHPDNLIAEAAAPAAAKVTASLRGLETHVRGRADLIIDHATARRDGEPISTATTEGTVQWLLHRRMGANQQMRWSPRGAHRMLKVRTAVANGTLTDDHAAAERWARRPFRPAA
jgi:hypothetical protein